MRHKTKRLACATSALAVATASLTALAIGSAAATTTGSTSTTGVQVAVISGADRIATSIAASQAAFQTAGSAKAVVLAQDQIFADALAGGPLAALETAPLLLTDPASITQATLAEIERVLPAGGTVYVLGGTSAISTTVSSAITSAGFVVDRLSGPTRFATAVAIAGVIKPTTIFEATGLVFADALAAGPAASANHGAILLTNGGTQAPETLSYLAANPGGTVYAIGGPAAAASPSATPIVGPNRFATATDVATKFFPNVQAIGLVSGLDAPDALSAVPVLAEIDSPMILVNPTGALPSSVTSYLTTNTSNILGVVAFGGSAALSDSVISEVTSLLNPTSSGNGTTTTTTGSGSTTSSTTATTTNSSGVAGLSSITSILSLLSGAGGLSALGGGTSTGGLSSLSSILGLLGGAGGL